MQSILVVTDLGDASDGALRTAARVAGHAGAGLHVLHAVGLVGLPLREAAPLLDARTPERLRASLDDQLRRTLPRGGETASRHLDYRKTQVAAGERASAVGAELVVIGAHAVESGDLAPLVETVRCPVLLVRSASPLPYERVLVPVGPGDLARATLRDACESLRWCVAGAETRQRADVHVLHVCSGLRAWRQVAEHLETEIRGAEERAWSGGHLFHRHVRWAVAPAAHIIETAGDVEADLVVLRPERGVPRSDAPRTWTTVVDRVRRNVLLLPGGRSAPDGPSAPRAEAVPAARGEEAREDELEPVGNW